MNYKFQHTLMIVNDDKLQACLGDETLVVCGSPRGMTSLVAYYLYESGYFLGNYLGAKNFEDQEFLKVIKPVEISSTPLQSLPAYQDLVSSRNGAHRRWGFKLPHAAGHVDSLNATLRNPVFVFCVRNPIATARSITKYENPENFSAGKLMEIATRHFSNMVAMCQSRDTPSIFIDMEAVKQHPGAFLQELATALNLPQPTPELAQKISTKGYKTTSSRPGVTFKPQ